MSLKRRDFFKLAATGAVTVMAGEALAKEENFVVDCEQSYGVLVDTVVCIGCRRCEWACKQENSLPTKELSSYDDKSVFDQRRRPDAETYTIVNRYIDKSASDKKYQIKLQCMHCNQPACASACIVGALQKTKSGPVTYDAWKCIGCRYCMVACPFQIPSYEYHNALNPQVRKCTFCAKRLENGLKPACVGICPNEALTFGTRQELVALAHSKIKQYPDKYFDHVYGEKEVGGTSWMYLASVDFANTDLPKLAERSIPEITEHIQHNIFKSFVPPLALYGLLGLVMHSLDSGKEKKEEANEGD